VSLRDYFDQRAREGSWGSLYDGPPTLDNYNFLTRRDAVLRLLAGEGPFARVLDVGCGTGDYAGVAARHGAEYHGIDYSAPMIAGARERTAAAGHSARLAVAAGDGLPYADSSFDLVLGLGYIAYFRDPRPPLEEIRRVLRPGGTAVLQVAKPDAFGSLEALVARERTVLPPGWVNVRYSQRGLDELMHAANFERTGFLFNNFHALPRRLRRRYPNAFIRLSELMTRASPGLFRPFAVNYVGRYRLK
jgi:SAM-dependent methyltransferase